MATPFIGEIRLFGFSFAPRNHAFCNGQLLSIAQNTALFSLLGTTYGGNGISTFALPNLQGVAPLHAGQGPGLSNRVLGETGGSPSVTLNSAEMPSHTHTLACSTNPGDQASPAGNIPAAGAGTRGQNFYADSAGSNPAMQASLVGSAGGNLPHNNLPPFLALNFCIALLGIFPSRN
jgi:microcystin-dependent protein